MNRIIGIDYGAKRIGISLSDPLNIIANDYCIIENQSDEYVLEQLAIIINKENVNKIVLGLPLNMDDTWGFQADIVKEFSEKIKKFNLPIIFIDERLSSQKAETILKELKVNNKIIRKNADKKAASIILQDYLDYHM